MGKASSTKKIQRVQRAGTKKVSGQRRPMGFPLACVAIIAVGSVLVWQARQAKEAGAASAPVANKDHWHYAYGFYDCTEYPDALWHIPDGPDDPLGIHTHADGLIHIHPFSVAVAGKRATFQKWADQVSIKLSDKEITFPAAVGHTPLKAGSTCTVDGKKKKAVLRAYVWPPQASNKVKPKVVTSDFGAIRFTQDGGTIVIALIPEGSKPPKLPPSIDTLKNPTAAEGAGSQQPTDTTQSTVPAEGSTTVPAGRSTTVPPEGGSTTVPAGATTIAPATATTVAPATTAKP